MLEKLFGQNIVREMWNQIKTDTAIEALRKVLPRSQYNSSWLKSLAEYGVWLYFTGNRSNSVQFFPEGENYPQIHENRYINFNFSEKLEIDATVLANSNKYIKLQNVDINQSFNFLFSSDATINAGFQVLSSSEVSPFYLNGDIMKNFNANEDSIIIVLTNTGNSEGSFNIVNLLPEKFAVSQNFPNPFNNKTSILVELINNTNFSLTIYNGIGETVKVLQRKETKPSGFYIYNWYGNNDVGKSVASGLYFAAFECNKLCKVLKLVYIK